MTTNRKGPLSRRDFLKLAGGSAAGLVLAATPRVGQAAVPSSQVTEITYFVHDDPDARSETLKQFSEMYPDIKVTIEQGVGDFSTLVLTYAAAGTLPDVVRLWEGMTIDMARAGQIIDLNPYIENEPDFAPEDFIEVFWNYPVLDDKRYGLADGAATHMNFFNKDLFDAADVPCPDPEEWTWDAFVEAARAITKPEEQLYGDDAFFVGWTHWNEKLAWQNGGAFFNPEGYVESWLDRPETIEAIQFWADLLHEAVIMPAPELSNPGGVLADFGGNLFQAGRAALRRVGTWEMRTYVQNEIDFGFAPEPMQAQRATLLHTAFNTITESSPNKDAAWTWLNFNNSTDGVYNYAHALTFMAVRRSANERQPWLIEEVEGVDWDLIPQSAEYGHLVPAPRNNEEALKMVGDALQRVYLGREKAEDVFKEVAPLVNELIKPEE